MLHDLSHARLNHQQQRLLASLQAFFSKDRRLSNKQLDVLESLHRRGTRAAYGTAMSDSERIMGKLNTVYNRIGR